MTKQENIHGAERIRQELTTMPSSPGVYRMLDAKGNVLYVGKAKDLKKRIANYTQIKALTPRLQRMVMQTEAMEIVTTRTEAEALLLEANLIKSLKPRYNILLRDDKSFPYITITDNHDFPQIKKHRGEKKKAVTYFGPFAAAGAVNQAIAVIQKAFLLRPCSDNVFANRTRPCLEYQIKRCSAPCVGKITREDYQRLVDQAKASLEGKIAQIQDQLTEEMHAASAVQEYEKAAEFRNRIQALSTIHAKQNINAKTVVDADIIALYQNNNQVCVQVFFIRAGQTLGNKPFFPAQTEDYQASDIIEAFIGRFYQTNLPPKHILLSHDVYSKHIVEEALSSIAKSKVRLHFPQKGEKRELIEVTLKNAKDALERKQSQEANQLEILEKVEKLFDVIGPIKRIEVYDNSHIFGSQAIGAMIVAGPEGFDKGSYRKYTIKPASKNSGGNDYAMLREVLSRRFGRLQKEHINKDNEQWPDLLLIDGGAGHLNATHEVLADLGLANIPHVCIAKGPDRNAGRETFHILGKAPFMLPKNDPVLHYLQRLRDEAHRFAITAHKKKRAQNLTISILDEIEGIGSVRKRSLLNHFGSVRGIEQATLQELAAVKHISKKMAKIIYDYLHSER